MCICRSEHKNRERFSTKSTTFGMLCIGCHHGRMEIRNLFLTVSKTCVSVFFVKAHLKCPISMQEMSLVRVSRQTNAVHVWYITLAECGLEILYFTFTGGLNCQWPLFISQVDKAQPFFTNKLKVADCCRSK